MQSIINIQELKNDAFINSILRIYWRKQLQMANTAGETLT